MTTKKSWYTVKSHYIIALNYFVISLVSTTSSHKLVTSTIFIYLLFFNNVNEGFTIMNIIIEINIKLWVIDDLYINAAIYLINCCHYFNS